MNCPNCNTDAGIKKFCPKCGTALVQDVFAQQNTTEISTSKLRILSCLNILCFWPVAIYGFYCKGKAEKFGVSANERSEWVSKGERVCSIGLLVFAVICVLSFLVTA